MNNKNKSRKWPELKNSYLLDFNITLLIQEAKSKKQAIAKAIKSLENHTYVLSKNLLTTKKYE